MTAVRRGVDFLTNLLSDPDCRRKGRLPTLARCATRSGLSKSTMSLAAAHLRGQGLIDPAPGVGLRIAGLSSNAGTVAKTPADAPLFDASQPAHVRIKSLILRDIVKGSFPPGKPLPSYKILRVRYGTGPLALKRAIGILAQELNLVPHKHGYAVPMTRHGNKPAIVLLYPRSSLVYRSRLYRWSPKLETMARYLEKRGYEANFTLFPHEFLGPGPSGGFAQHSVADLRLDDLSRKQTVIGYVYWDTAEYLHQTDLVKWLIRCGKPVVIVDDSGDFPRELLERSSPLTELAVFGASSFAPRRIAQHLLQLGHIKAAFVTLYHRLPWSQGRLDVLRSVFGPDRGIVVTPEAPAQDETPSSSLLTINRYSLIPELLPLLEQLYQNKVPKKIERLLGGLYTSLLSLTESLSLEDLNRALDAIIADRDITAIVCVNDEIALYSMRYLQSKKIRIPEDFSIVGFDDTLEAAASGLTTLNFDIEAAANMVLDHLLRPPSARSGKGQARIVETEGILMERTTTGVARTAQENWSQT